MDALLRDLRTAPAPALMAVSGAGFISLAISPPATPGLSLCGSLSSVTLADLSPLVLDGHTLGILGVAWLAGACWRRACCLRAMRWCGWQPAWSWCRLPPSCTQPRIPRSFLPALPWRSCGVHRPQERAPTMPATGCTPWPPAAPRPTGTACSTDCEPAWHAPRHAGRGCWRPSPFPRPGTCRPWLLQRFYSLWSAQAHRCGPPGACPMSCGAFCTASRARRWAGRQDTEPCGG